MTPNPVGFDFLLLRIGRGLGIEERDQAMGDLFVGEALADLLYHLAARPDYLLQIGDSPIRLAWQAAIDARRGQSGFGKQASGLTQGCLGQLPNLFGQALLWVFALVVRAIQPLLSKIALRDL